MAINKDDILQSTLFHIQVNNCQYIDNFPEVVADTFNKMINVNGIKAYKDMKRKLYRIDTSFFKINSHLKKRDFYLGLFERISNKV